MSPEEIKQRLATITERIANAVMIVNLIKEKSK